jgi:uncharacterized membrane protein
MSEFESLATIEGLDEHVRRHSYDRLIMLSDGIFAIATTLAALDVRLPAHAGSLWDALVGGRRGLVAYLLSFIVAGVFWISNRDLFARLRKVDMPLTVLTLAMLCMIALIPAAIRSVYLEGGSDAALRLYALAMFVAGLLNGAMWVYASLRPGLMLPAVTRAYRWIRVAASAALPLLFLPILIVPPEQAAPFMLPGVALVVLLRRVLLPKWLGRKEAGAQ